MDIWKILAVGLLISCSHQQVHKGGEKVKSSPSENGERVQNESLEEGQQREGRPLNTYESSAERSLKIVSRKLEELIASAKAAGRHAVDYLASDIFLKANAASMHGDWNTAKVLFKHLLVLVPTDDYVKRKYAESLIRVGLLNDAQIQLEEIFEKSKRQNEKVGLILAGVYSSLLEKDQARKIYSHLLKINPKNHDACIYLGKSYAHEGQIDEALGILAKCEKNQPKNSLYSYYMGKMALEKGRNEEALRHFSRSLRLDPEDSKSALAVGVIYEELGQMEKALKVYQNLLNINPTDQLILNKVVELLFSLSKNREVIPYLMTLSQMDPENLNIKVKLGVLYTDIGEYEKSKEIFKNLLTYAPNSDKVLYYLGSIYQETNEFEQSLEYFSKIPPESSLFYGSSLQMAQMLMITAGQAQGDGPSERVKAFLDFIDQRSAAYPDLKVQLMVFKASFYENKMELDKAIVVLEGIRNDKDFDKTHNYYLATLYEKVNRFDEAYAIGMQILKEDPQNAHAWNFIGYSLLERGVNLNKAYEYIQKAIALKPDDGFIRDSLGWYYYKVGKLDLALKEMQKARKSVKDDVVISKHLAMVYQSLKQFDMAKKYYAEALKNTKVESERLSVIKAMEGMLQGRVPASVDESK